MPEGILDADIREKASWIVEKCKESNFNFSPRLHVWLWEGRRGV